MCVDLGINIMPLYFTDHATFTTGHCSETILLLLLRRLFYPLFSIRSADHTAALRKAESPGNAQKLSSVNAGNGWLMDDASVATATVTKAVIASTMTIVKCHASNHQQRQYNVGINVQMNTYSIVDITVICMVNLNTFGQLSSV